MISPDLVFLWDSKCKMPGRRSPEAMCGELLALGREFLLQMGTDGFPCWQPSVLYSRRKVRAIEAPEMERGWSAPRRTLCLLFWTAAIWREKVWAWLPNSSLWSLFVYQGGKPGEIRKIAEIDWKIFLCSKAIGQIFQQKSSQVPGCQYAVFSFYLAYD